MLTTLIFGVLVQGAVAPTVVDGRWSFGAVKVGDQQVSLNFPGSGLEPPSTPVITSGGKRFVVGSDGTVSVARGGDGGWGEFTGPLARLAAAPNAQKWRAKVFIFTRSELLSRPGPGDYRFRRGRIESYMLGPIRESLARLGGMVRAKTEGRIDVDFDVEIDDDPEMATVSNDAADAYGQPFVNRVLGPRVNSDNFTTDDGIYRGPYHSVFYIHPGRVESFPLGELRGMPVSGISYFTRPVLAETDRLTLSLYASWIRQLTARVRQIGYQSPVVRSSFDDPFSLGPDQYVTPGMWPAVLNLGGSSTADKLAREFRPEVPSSAKWSDVAPDPLARLPKLESTNHLNSEAVQRVLAGGSASAIISRPPSNGGAENTLVVTPLSKAAMIGELLESKRNAKTLGFLEGKIQNAIVFSFDGSVYGGLEANALASPLNVEVARQNPAKAGLQQIEGDWVFVGKPSQQAADLGPPSELRESLRTEGEIRGEKAAEIFEITERGFFRNGEVNLYQADGGGFDVAAQPVLSFEFRQSGKDIFALQIDFVPSGRAYVVLGEAPFLPVGAIRRDEPWVAVTRGADNTWTPVKISLADLAKQVKSTRIRRIAVTPIPYFEYQERQQTQANSVSLSRLTFGSDETALTATMKEFQPTASGLWGDLESLTADASSEQRARIQLALADENRRIRMAALEALTRVNMPEALPAVEAELKSASAWSAMFAARVLAEWNSAESNAALRRGLDVGPFDHSRLAVTESITKRKDNGWTSSISLLYASRSWRARECAVRALGQIASRESALIGVSFLRDGEPSVRLAFVASADLSNELVARRLVFAAVNDPSEEVRAVAAERLLSAEASEFRSEALRASREESRYVRTRVLDAFAAKPAADQRPFIAQSLLDPIPSVRAAAVRALAAQAAVATPDEWQSLRSESAPEVLLAIADYCEVRNVPAGDAIRQNLQSCPDPRVRERLSRVR